MTPRERAKALAKEWADAAFGYIDGNDRERLAEAFLAAERAAFERAEKEVDRCVSNPLEHSICIKAIRALASSGAGKEG